MDRSILVIGAAGLVGRHVHAALSGRDVVTTFHRAPVDGGTHLDITDEVAVRRLVARLRPAAVVLAAADPYVEGCERDPTGTRRVNVDAARTVRDAATDVDAMLVVFSSEYVFDGTKGIYTEQDAVAPLNEYGRQKRELEMIASAAPRHLVLRISGVFGEEARHKNFVWQLVDRLRAGGRLDVPSDQLITPTDASSLARVVVELLDRGVSGLFHTAGPDVLTRVEFANMIARAFALPSDQVVPRPTAALGLLARRPQLAGLSDARLRSVLGHGLAHPADALALLARAERP